MADNAMDDTDDETLHQKLADGGSVMRFRIGSQITYVRAHVDPDDPESIVRHYDTITEVPRPDGRSVYQTGTCSGLALCRMESQLDDYEIDPADTTPFNNNE